MSIKNQQEANIFQGVKRLFALSMKGKVRRTSYKWYYLLTVEVKK